MCTATWFPTADGYELFFNRDELRSRRRASAPARFHAGVLAAAAPTDTDAGGTWLATNENGLTVALLNRYQDSVDTATDDRRRSRGLLVRDLVAEPSLGAVLERVAGLELDVYAPFTLLLLAPGKDATTLFWNGRRLSPSRQAMAPLASSGHKPLAVPAARRELWAGIPLVDRDACLRFHAAHEPSRGAESPCMHRYDARTVSLIHVVVGASAIRMFYADGPPCVSPLQLAVEMPRVARKDADAA